jgi:hypothetical protein
MVPPVAKTPSKAARICSPLLIEASAQKTGNCRVSEAVTASGKVKKIIEIVREAFNVPGGAIKFF